MNSRASLRIFGDTLVPDAVTHLLGCKPTRAQSKGNAIRGKTGRERVALTGSWHLEAERRDPEDLSGQITEICDRLSPDPKVWASLASEFRIDLFCGLFMVRANEGISISPDALAALGSRGIALSLDIYDANDVDAPAPEGSS